MRFCLSGLVTILILQVFLPSAFAQEGPPAPAPLPNHRNPCALFTSNTTYVTSTLVMDLEQRTVRLRVPTAYYEDPWNRKDGRFTTSQLFRVELGSFLPVRRSETSERIIHGLVNWMTFNATDLLPLEDIAALNAEQSNGNHSIKHSYADLSHKIGPFGLETIAPTDLNPTISTKKDTYVATTPIGELTAVIQCDKPNTVLNPGCQHSFRAAGMDIYLQYRRQELPNWSALQSDVTRFLVCATSPSL